jgi:hypothetical protein
MFDADYCDTIGHLGTAQIRSRAPTAALLRADGSISVAGRDIVGACSRLPSGRFRRHARCAPRVVHGKTCWAPTISARFTDFKSSSREAFTESEAHVYQNGRQSHSTIGQPSKYLIRCSTIWAIKSTKVVFGRQPNARKAFELSATV